MYKFVEKLQNELESGDRMPLFEIEVVDVSGTTDFILCDIFFKGNSLIAERDAISTKEQRSKYIGTSSIICDSACTLDEHLQSLYTKILDDIINGDLYKLAS